MPDLSSIQIQSGSPFPLGATVQSKGINFAVYVKEAHHLSICLFEEKTVEHSIKEIELDPKKHQTGRIWHALLTGLPDHMVYGFKISFPDQPDKEYLLLDPYAKAIASDSIWGGQQIGSEQPYRPLGKVISHAFDWEGDQFPKIPMKNLIIYEMHVRGFTQDPSSGVQHPGTYKGLMEKIPYLKDLGINAIELMPIHEFNEREALQHHPKTKQKLYNYFGYSTVNFFSPMVRFASQTEKDQVIIEFKTLVKELHKNGIEVILDVVFNHTFEGNEQGPILCYRGLDRHAYYMIDGESYLNFSGCGNTFNCNHPIVRELILDSLRYWVTEMHVDGFRFDLASILTRGGNGAPLSNPPLVDAISYDPVLADTKLIAEAWDAGGLYQVGYFTPGSTRWSEWNGKYRDTIRRFIKGTPDHKTAFATALCGSQDLYGHGRAPYCSVNFMTAHDGFSLADLVTYNDKHNWENGEDNRDGFNYNDSWNCGFEGHSSNKRVVALRERQIRNFHLALMLSQGVPMLLMGDEYGHTRNGNNNTWCQDNELNWFLWNRMDARPGFYPFYRFMIHFRNQHPLLRKDTFLTDKHITWHGQFPFNPDWSHDNRLVAFTLNNSDQRANLYTAFNAGHLPITITIPPAPEGKHWFWVVNTHQIPPDDFYDEARRIPLEALTYRLYSYSAILLQALPINEIVEAEGPN
jgi:isoamylase/glycogen operon protein